MYNNKATVLYGQLNRLPSSPTTNAQYKAPLIFYILVCVTGFTETSFLSEMVNYSSLEVFFTWFLGSGYISLFSNLKFVFWFKMVTDTSFSKIHINNTLARNFVQQRKTQHQVLRKVNENSLWLIAAAHEEASYFCDKHSWSLQIICLDLRIAALLRLIVSQ